MTGYLKYSWSVYAACFLDGSVLIASLVSGQAQSPKAPASDETMANTNDIPGLGLEPQTTQNQFWVSGDYLIGKGNLSVPFGFGLGKNPGLERLPNLQDLERSSDYFGGTISYSYGQIWYIDVSYSHGDQRANFPLDQALGTGVGIPEAPVTISDDWYQAYFKYAFPKLRGKKVTAYLRAGVTYVQSELSFQNTSFSIPGRTFRPGEIYNQKNDTTDILGNLGFGVGYSVFKGERIGLSLQLEGEGFGGSRKQEMDEHSPFQGLGNKAQIDNWFYGGLGRWTLRLEYAIGRREVLKLFADGGIQARYTLVVYNDFRTPNGGFVAGSTQGELLWGPYVRAGISYSF